MEITLPHISEIKKLTFEQQQEFYKSLTPEQLFQFKYDWKLHARPNQLLPEEGWSEALVLAGRGFGKECSIDTPIITPSGMTTLGQIQVGDKVIDENGKECNVLAVYEKDPDVKKYYNLKFSDGTEIKCCSDHQWVTWEHRDREAYGSSNEYNGGERPVKLPHDWPNWKRASDLDIGPSVKTTQQIIDTFTHGKKKDANHSVPVCRPIEFSEKELPIDPYLLGYWLGDGGSGCGVITCDPIDQDSIINHCDYLGYTLGNNSCFKKISILGLAKRLKKNNCDKKEYIPNDYRVSSREQRLALLQGLMDSNGFCHKENGYVEFSQSIEWISELCFYLAVSLGQKPTINKHKSQLNGEYKQDRYRVTWCPIQNTNPFRLKRKADLVHPAGKQNLRNLHRMIVSYEEIEKIPMRCLAVDSPNSLFLIGNSMIPTHNTRVGSEWTRNAVENQGCKRIALIAPNVASVRDVIYGGESGLENISPPWNRPRFIHSKAEIVWDNGAKAKVISSEEIDALRGPQFDAAWIDEIAACKNPSDLYDAIQFGLRLTSSKGYPPRLLMTTTPRPIPLIKELIEESKKEGTDLLLITGSTYENEENLNAKAVKKMYDKYKGTRLGRQELEAELLSDHEGALWTAESIDFSKQDFIKEDNIYEYVEKMQRIVVGVDPSGSDGTGGDETGIVIAGKDDDDIYYVLGDFTLRGSPETWGQKVVDVCREYQVDKIVVEKNNGGDMVRSVIHNIWKDAPIKKVHAKRGKHLRAQPVSMLYEQGRVKHINDFVELEEQMTNMTESGYKGKNSPDRLDALVYAILDLRNSNKMSFEGVTIKGRHH